MGGMTKPASIATLLLGISFSATFAPAPTQHTAATVLPDSVDQAVVITQPPGALIIVLGHTIGPAPTTFRLARPSFFGFRDEFDVLALTTDSALCSQHRWVRYNEATPDTVWFDMHRCPPRQQDFARVFEDSELTSSPRRVSSPPVRYPDVLRQINARGAVVLDAVIDTAGLPEPRTVRVLFTTRRSLFEGPAQEILRQSRFEPGRVYDRKVRARARVTIHFTPERVY